MSERVFACQWTTTTQITNVSTFSGLPRTDTIPTCFNAINQRIGRTAEATDARIWKGAKEGDSDRQTTNVCSMGGNAKWLSSSCDCPCFSDGNVLISLFFAKEKWEPSASPTLSLQVKGGPSSARAQTRDVRRVM